MRVFAGPPGSRAPAGRLVRPSASRELDVEVSILPGRHSTDRMQPIAQRGDGPRHSRFSIAIAATDMSFGAAAFIAASGMRKFEANASASASAVCPCGSRGDGGRGARAREQRRKCFAPPSSGVFRKTYRTPSRQRERRRSSRSLRTARTHTHAVQLEDANDVADRLLPQAPPMPQRVRRALRVEVAKVREVRLREVEPFRYETVQLERQVPAATARLRNSRSPSSAHESSRGLELQRPDRRRHEERLREREGLGDCAASLPTGLVAASHAFTSRSPTPAIRKATLRHTFDRSRASRRRLGVKFSMPSMFIACA